MQFKWIRFEEIDHSGTTRKFNCFNSEYGSHLGVVKWYGSFRKYSFFPEENIVFESQCLKDIASFLESLMLERKLKTQSNANR